MDDHVDELPPAPRPAPNVARPAAFERPPAHRQPDIGPKHPLVEGYEILRELGRGGMGVVYLARQVSLNRLVALKMILAGSHASPQELLRFRSEAEAAAQLTHANIVQIYEVGQHAGQPFLALEYVAGGSLADQLAGAPLPPRESAQLVENLARAVQFAHEHGVVHRDLKPSNILSQKKEASKSSTATEATTAFHSSQGDISCFVPKITDFGLAKALKPSESARDAAGNLPSVVSLTQTGMILGTPSYMAPEQAQGDARRISPATDVYALGAILYELLTGRPPFRAATALETLKQVIEEEPVSPSRLQPRRAGTRDLETICLKCLQKEPLRRYASAAELADELRRYLNGEPIRARRTGTAERLLRWCKRNPKVASLLALLLVVFFAGFAGVLLQWQRAERQRWETEKNYQLARQIVSDYFEILGDDPLLDRPGALSLRRELLETALRHFDDLRQGDDDPQLQVHLARACQCMGEIEAHHDRYEVAVAHYQRAITIQDELVREYPREISYQRDLALSSTLLSHALIILRKYDAARDAQQRGLAIHDPLHRANPADGDLRRDLASSYIAIGFLHHAQGDSATAVSWYQQARDLSEELVREKPDDLAYQATLSATLNNLGLAFTSLGKHEEALAVYRAAVDRQVVFSDVRQAAKYRVMVSQHYFNMARYALLPLKRPREAVEAVQWSCRLNPEDYGALWFAARVLVQAAEMLGEDETALRQEYAEMAMEMLADAARFGLKDPGPLDIPDLKPLWSREDFQQLRAQLQKGSEFSAK